MVSSLLVFATLVHHVDPTLTITLEATGPQDLAKGANMVLIGPVGKPFDYNGLGDNRTGKYQAQVAPGKYFVMISHTKGFTSAQLNIGNRDLNETLRLSRGSQSEDHVFCFDNSNCNLISGTSFTPSKASQVSIVSRGIETILMYPVGSEVVRTMTVTHPRYEEKVFQHFNVNTTTVSYDCHAVPMIPKSAGSPIISTKPAVVKSNYKLDGMIRMANRDRIVVGKLCTVSVNLQYSGGLNLKSNGAATVVIKDPNGRVIMNRSESVSLPLNTYAEKKYEVTPTLIGKYTVTVNGTGEGGSKWDGTFSFTVLPK